MPSRRQFLLLFPAGLSVLSGCGRVLGDSDPSGTYFHHLAVSNFDTARHTLDLRVALDERVVFDQAVTLGGATDTHIASMTFTDFPSEKGSWRVIATLDVPGVTYRESVTINGWDSETADPCGAVAVHITATGQLVVGTTEYNPRYEELCA